jgi:hypothetical protein
MMTVDAHVGRRRILRGTAGTVLGLLTTIGCKKKVPNSCTDTTGLASEDIEARRTLAYVDASPFPDKMCESCQQFVPAKVSGGCGSCKILKGPTHPYGYCKSFAAKA